MNIPDLIKALEAEAANMSHHPHYNSAYCRALTLVRQLDEWQPIETLPKTDEYYPFLGFFGNTKKMGLTRKTAIIYCPDERNLAFRDVSDNVQFATLPTHWMPLPTPPAMKEKK